MASIPANPNNGKGPVSPGKGGMKPATPQTKVKDIARGAPTRGSGSDTSPYSSARGRK